jgi:hypothetical protein
MQIKYTDNHHPAVGCLQPIAEDVEEPFVEVVAVVAAEDVEDVAAKKYYRNKLSNTF